MRVFAESLFDAPPAQLPGDVEYGGEHLFCTDGLHFVGDMAGHSADELRVESRALRNGLRKDRAAVLHDTVKPLHDGNDRNAEAGVTAHVRLYLPHGLHVLFGGVGERLDASPADSAGGGRQFFEIDLSFVVEVFEMDVAHLRDLFTQGHPSQQVVRTFPGREVPVLVGRTHGKQHRIHLGEQLSARFGRVLLSGIGPCLFHAEIVRFGDFPALHIGAQILEESLPARQVVISEQAAPFLVGIVVHAGIRIGGSPVGDLRLGVFQRLTAFLFVVAVMQGLVEPSSQQKIRLRARETVLKSEQREEIGRKQTEPFTVAATVCLDGPLVDVPGVVGEHLACQIGQVVTVCRRVPVLLRRLAEQDQRIDELCRVVLEPFGAPCRNAGDVQSGAGAEDGFEGPFPLDGELAVNGPQQQPPGFVDMVVPCAVAIGDVSAQVVVGIGRSGLPGRFQGPVIDDRIGGDTFGQDTHAAEEILGFGTGLVGSRENHRKLAAHIGLAAEMVYGGPDPRGAVELPGVSPRRTALPEEVDDHGQCRVEPCEQFLLRIAAPSLEHPFRSGEMPLHGGLDQRRCAGHVHPGRIASLVEEVAAEVVH